MPVHEFLGGSYYFSDLLKRHWDRNSLARMKKLNADRVYIVDGMERTGKSWWTFQQAGYLDEEMFSSPEEMVKRVCFSPEEFLKAIRTVKNGVIIFDEAFRGLSSRAALSKVNKKIISGLMEMGQNNNIVFIVLPRIFLLDIYVAMLRSHGFFNIYAEKRTGKRAWRGYSMQDKNYLYQHGIKKGWKYSVRTRFKDRFYDKFPGGDKYMKAYLQKKEKAFQEIEVEQEEQRYEIYKGERDKIIVGNRKKHFKTNVEVSKWLLEDCNMKITPQHVGRLLKEAEKAEKMAKKANIEPLTL